MKCTDNCKCTIHVGFFASLNIDVYFLCKTITIIYYGEIKQMHYNFLTQCFIVLKYLDYLVLL